MLSKKKLVVLCWCFVSTVLPNFKFNSPYSGLRLSGANAQLSLETPITGFDGTLEVTNKSATSITRATALDTLSFSKGMFKSGTTASVLTGTLDPNTTDTITLDSGQSLETESGAFVEALVVKGAGNIVRGKPVFGSAITLFDSSAELHIGIQTPLTQSVTLNGGTVKLLDNLELQDGVLFDGTGTIDINNKRLVLPAVQGSPWTSTLDILNGNDVALTGKTTLNGTLNFTGNGASTNYNGNGNILDVSGGGVLRVRNGHTLYLTDIHVKGVSAGTFVLDTATSTVRFSNVTLELAGNPAITQGTWRFEGNQCNIITRSSFKILVNTGGTLTIDGIALLYDPLGTSPVEPGPIDNSGGGTLNLLNNAVIRTNFPASGASGDIEYSATSNTLSKNFFLSSQATLTFINATPLVAKAMSLDAQGHIIYFNDSSGQNMILQENITLTITNARLTGFDPALINYIGAGATKAKIVFGDNVTVELSKNLTVAALDNAWAFNGNATLNGYGNTLTLNGASRLTATGANKTLTLKDVRIVVSNASGIAVSNNDTTLKMQNLNLHMTSAGWTLGTGSIQFADSVLFSGRDATAAPGVTCSFSLTTKKLATILSQSAVKFDKGTKLFYNVDVTDDLGDPAVERRHFVFTDPSSVLDLDSAILEVGTMGIAFDHGKINIDGNVQFDIDAAAEFEFGEAVQAELAPSAILDINGVLRYVATTFP